MNIQGVVSVEGVNKKIIFLALILSLFTSLFIYSYINRLTKTGSSAEFVKICVAAKTIPARVMITPADVKVIEIEKKYVHQGAFQNKAEIIGKRVKESVLQGEQILKDRLANEDKLSLSYTIPEGKRAISINVNESSIVGNFVVPGDFVDIIATFEKEEVKEADKKIVYPKMSKIVLQNVRVLGIGQEDYIAEGDKKKEIPKTITLAVNKDDAEKIVLASEIGVIRLALRSVGDTQEVQSDGTLREEITGNKGSITVTN